MKEVMTTNNPGEFNFSQFKVVNKNSIEAKLYKLIDDIDTLSDVFKPVRDNYYKHVMQKVKQARKYIISDGYKLYYRKDTEKSR